VTTPRRGEACANERGVILVLVSIVLPLILILSVVVVDVGNWWVHKRHLQTQVDAGALAGATRFVGCSFQFGNPPAANEAIRATALEYSGDTARDATTRNVQVQEPNDVRVVLNSTRYWTDTDSPTGVGPHPLDDTLDHDSNPATPGDPCSSKTLDVKATDDDAPLLFGFLPFVADPKSHARVEIRQIKEQQGMLPWAVPDLEPAAVAALFVDENNGTVFDHQLLMPWDDTSLPFSEWRTPMGQETVDLPGENNGIVILVSKVDDTPDLSGTLTQICTRSPGLIGCYAGDGNQDGLAFIHGWAGGPAGMPQQPQIRDVGFYAATCNDDFAAPYFLRSAEDCAIGVEHAVIDFGIPTDPTLAPPTGVNAVVTLEGPGCGSNGCPMAYVGQGVAANESIWEMTGIATLNPRDHHGRLEYSIHWETEWHAGTTHSGTFDGVAHPYVTDDRSGPIDYLKITTPDVDPAGNPIPYPYSRDSGELSNVVVTVGLRKPLAIEDPLVPPILLRVASPSGSQNQAFDCDKNVNFQTEIENGCRTTYALNYDDWSVPKDGIKEWADILCDGYDVGDLPPSNTAAEPAPICVAVETGDKIGQFRQGLTKRFETPDCWQNNWPESEDEIDDFFKSIDETNDPRYVTLIITDFGTFQGAGNDQVPVKYFAGFYVTGWDVTGNAKPCLDNDPHPWYGETYRRSLDNGDVWGHFVNIVKFSSAGKPNEQLCNFDELGNCIAVLVE
jgi:Putative Flp pilus-assembly TadE/G-like